MSRFVHLHTHSEYSVLDGHANIERLLDRAWACDMPALALTDHGVMFGAVEFYRAAVKPDPKKTERGPIKPIIGCEIYFTPQERTTRDGKPRLSHLLLLAKNMTGYRNLMAMVSESHIGGFYYKPRVDEELLRRHSEGLIATSACMSGLVSKSFENGTPEEARKWAEFFASVFPDGDFYLEIQEQGIVADNGMKQADLTRAIAQLGGELGIPLVATNDVHYVDADHAKAQDMLVCINTGRTLDDPDRLKFSSDQFYFKDCDEMSALMADYPQALASTIEIAEKCQVDLEFGKIILPVFETPAGTTEDEHLRAACLAGLARRYGDPVPVEAMERVETELAVITEKGLSAYFLIVADFVQWAKDRSIGVGPGRGSAAGSIVSYALGITALDPLEHGLLFERFLNPERTEMPDIDIDFDDERRGEVIEYVRDKYGGDRVAQVVTYSRMKARQAVRDAGRLLGYPFGVPDKVAKQIVDDPKATIASSLKVNAELRADFEEGGDTHRILDAAMALEGVVRGEGVHPAAVVICRDPIAYYSPLKKDTKQEAVITQYDGPVVADLGLLKMDFLGLRTLTVIAKAVTAITENHGVAIDIDTLPMDDAPTFELLQRADTDGVFQVESAGMKRVLKNLKPTVFADIVAVVALFRPGPMDSINDFVARKHGKAQVTYYDERLRHILEETYGAIVYQEQAMLIAMEMAGFTAAKADKLRKGMGKKIMEIVDALKPEFIEGATARGYARGLAERVWSDIEKFGEYAFNKSHAAAYGLIAYQTAYLKAHYPYEYMAAVLTSYTGKSDSITKYIGACNRAGLTVLPPDVNSSGKDFTAVGAAIRFGLAGIRNVGEGIVEQIVAERVRSGAFDSLQAFCERVDMRQMNKKTVESLIKAGAFDTTGYTRKHLLAMMEEAVDGAMRRQRDAADGQTSLFDLDNAAEHGFELHVPPPNGDEWEKRMKLAFEKEMLGIYVSDHPLSDIAELIERSRTASLADPESLKDGTTIWVAGIITKLDRIVTKAGKMMCSISFEDLDGSIEGRLFPQVFDRFREAVVEDGVVRIRAKVENSDRGIQLLVQEVQSIAPEGDRFERPPGKLVIEAPRDWLTNGGSAELKAVLARYPGRDSVHLRVVMDHATKEAKLADEIRVDADAPTLHAELKALLGPGSVRQA